MRDLTFPQLKAKLAKYGFVSEGILGYYKLPVPHDHISVSRLNGGPRNRTQLAYMLAQLAKVEKETSC
ncbi:MAG: hypothetical protein ACYDHZ_10795 [Dehalococcoidia bacterium]